MFPFRGRPARVLLFTLTLILCLGMASTRRRHLARSNKGYAEAPDLLRQRLAANDLLRAGSFEQAIRKYQTGYDEAQRRGDTRSARRFLANLGTANFRLLRYRDAVKAYLQVRALAEAEGDNEALAAVAFNLSSVYLQMGEFESATESARFGLALPPAASAKFRPQLLMQSALIAQQQGNCQRATTLIREAVELSRDQLDVSGEAQAWNELGNVLLDCNRPADADNALLEAYRIRKLTHDKTLSYSYESLAEVRLAGNDSASALPLLNRAIEAAAPLGPAALWRPLYSRARANQRLDRMQEAYLDIRTSLADLKDWRSQVLPSDAFRIGADVESHGVYAAFIDIAGQLYRKTGQSRYAEEGFAAAEEGRAASLRLLWSRSELPRGLTEDYWRTVAALHTAESAELRADSASSDVRRLRVRLAEMEAAAGLELTSSAEVEQSGGNIVRLTQSALGSDQAYFAFQTGEFESWLWVITHDGFAMLALPPEAELKREVAAFVDAVRNDSPAVSAMGARLFRQLFGKVDSRLLRATAWTIAVDGPLFELPFAALVQDDLSASASPRYLIAAHSIRMTTGVAALLRPAPATSGDRFVAVGDPIYNRADPRLERSATLPKPALMELPRLVGSGREVEACANVWRAHGRRTLVLSGANANKQALAGALREGPPVVHVAAHMVFPSGRDGRGMLALSLQPGNEIELLGDTEVTGMRGRVGLVVLNACGSGRGAALPGAGLMGMTRAWLAAGARGVIATRWPTPDQEEGGMFPSLYKQYLLARTANPESYGALLRQAQLEELQAGGSRASPSRWASYFSVERSGRVVPEAR